MSHQSAPAHVAELMRFSASLGGRAPWLMVGGLTSHKEHTVDSLKTSELLRVAKTVGSLMLSVSPRAGNAVFLLFPTPEVCKAAVHHLARLKVPEPLAGSTLLITVPPNPCELPESLSLLDPSNDWVHLPLSWPAISNYISPSTSSLNEALKSVTAEAEAVRAHAKTLSQSVSALFSQLPELWQYREDIRERYLQKMVASVIEREQQDAHFLQHDPIRLGPKRAQDYLTFATTTLALWAEKTRPKTQTSAGAAAGPLPAAVSPENLPSPSRTPAGTGKHNAEPAKRSEVDEGHSADITMVDLTASPSNNIPEESKAEQKAVAGEGDIDTRSMKRARMTTAEEDSRSSEPRVLLLTGLTPQDSVLSHVKNWWQDVGYWMEGGGDLNAAVDDYRIIRSHPTPQHCEIVLVFHRNDWSRRIHESWSTRDAKQKLYESWASYGVSSSQLTGQ
ncbi:hypothetical protein JCM10908_004137 [Rhodotorula pacifica]|uniref:uncharacterized protein n=1 Tax=Rhodotorula pacifica TaxID=1495444 RepID=UPI0031727A38